MEGRRLSADVCEDDNICTSPMCKRVRHDTKALFDLVPRNFSLKYRNPCWNSSLRIPHDLSQYFSKMWFPKFNDNTTMNKPVIREFNVSQFLSNRHNQSQFEQRIYCLPFLYLAGFPKCGTTSLYQMVVQHPLVAKPFRKEGHFWYTFTEYSGTYKDKFIHVLFHLHQFQDAAQQITKSQRSITIDASASTLWKALRPFEDESDMSVVPSVINELTPTARFIVIMRDPVKRLFSDFWYFCSRRSWVKKRHNFVPKYYLENGRQVFHNFTAEAVHDFRDCVAKEKISLLYECVRRVTYVNENDKETDCRKVRLGIGMYYYHITRWLRVIPRERFLFLRSEDLSLDAYSTMERVWRFLDLPPQTRQQMEASLARRHEWNTNDWIKSEKYRERFAMLPETERMLREFYRPHNEKLAELLSDPHYLWN